MPIQSAEDLKKLVDAAVEKLEANKQQEAANRLRSTQTVFTTSSEWWGELGLAIRSIQKEFQLDLDVERVFDEIMEIVKRAWPTL